MCGAKAQPPGNFSGNWDDYNLLLENTIELIPGRTRRDSDYFLDNVFSGQNRGLYASPNSGGVQANIVEDQRRSVL